MAPGERDRDSCDSADPDALEEPIGQDETEKKSGRAAGGMPDDDEAVTSRPVFHAVVTVMLSDGELTMEERRLAIKLGSLLFKGDDLDTEPKLIYDAVVAGEPVKGGRVIDKQERLEICRKMIETAYVNSSLSQDELAAIAMLRSAMAITEGEILEVRADIYRDLEEEVEPKLLGKVRKDIREIFQKVEEFILPKSGD